MEILEKIADKFWKFQNSGFGMVYSVNGFILFLSWLFSWETAFGKTLSIADVLTCALVVYGLVKFVIWFVKDMASLIAWQFKYQVGQIVRQELKNLSKV